MSRNADSDYGFLGWISPLLILVGLLGGLLYVGMLLFATRIPDWLGGVWAAAAGLGLMIFGVELGLRREGFGATVAAFAIGAFLFAFGLDTPSDVYPMPPIRSLPESHTSATVSIEPNMIPPSAQGELRMMILNNSDETFNLSRIELRVPTVFWQCFVLDHAASEPSIVETDQKRSLIELHGVTLTANETWTTSIPVVGNQPGDCSGAFTVHAPGKIGRSFAKISHTTQLNLSVVP